MLSEISGEYGVKDGKADIQSAGHAARRAGVRGPVLIHPGVELPAAPGLPVRPGVEDPNG